MTNEKKNRIKAKLKLAKQNYFKIERQLKKAEQVLSKAYKADDERVKYEHMEEKYEL
jgi:cellobiose-specific phosphotransferase system component IIA